MPTVDYCTTVPDGTTCDEGGTVAHGSCHVGVCTGIASFVSGFETSLDGWTTGSSSFLLGSGGTPSGGTGPSAAAVGNGYTFVEASYGAAANLNHLQQTVPAGQELYGIAFQYHMYDGAFKSFGNASLESSADGVDFTTLWTKNGNQGNQWHQATVFVPSGGHRMLRYTCVPNRCQACVQSEGRLLTISCPLPSPARFTDGTDAFNDFALDDIRVGDCSTVGCAPSSNGLGCVDIAGSCDTTTGRCSAESVKANGTLHESENTVLKTHKSECTFQADILPVLWEKILKAMRVLQPPPHDNPRCDDGDWHTTNDICVSGLCRGCPVPTDECELQMGSFDPLSQQCPPTTFKPDGTTCDSETTQVSRQDRAYYPGHIKADSQSFSLCALALLSISRN